MNIFPLILFGHGFGDYFFQNNWMAQNKKKNTFVGYYACVLHCFVYTICVVLSALLGGYSLSLYQIPLIFLSHFIPDKYNLISRWSSFYGIRTWDSEIKFSPLDSPATIKDSINISFGAFVSIVQDNLVHLFLMYLIFCL